jgi:hypothetical protein
MIFSAALLSTALGLVSAQCQTFGSLRNPDIPNPSVILSPTNSFYTDNVFNFALNMAPSAIKPVVISTSVNNSRLTTRPSALTFSSTNFTTPQSVEIIVPNNSNMTPITGTSPLALSFTSSNQAYADTNCMSATAIRTTSVNLVLNSVSRGGISLTSPASTSCSTVFGNIINPTIPAPYVWVSPNSTTYVDNTFRFVPNYGLSSNVTFSVSTGNTAFVATPSRFTITPAQATAKTPVAVNLTIASNTPVTSLAFPYNLTIRFSPEGQSFGFPPATYNIAFSGEKNDFGIGGWCYVDCFLW